MARACIENVTFIALACDQQPHFTTLAHFVATLGKEVEAVFRDVLMVCNAQGLIGKAMFAIDGCKLPSKNRVCPNCSRRQTAGSRLHTTRCNKRRKWAWPPRRDRADRPRILASMAPPSALFTLCYRQKAQTQRVSAAGLTLAAFNLENVRVPVVGHR